MIKLLVVDDESYTKEGILEDYPWADMGISEVQGADNGIEAFEIAVKMNPDIILTDVKMPRMDGIHLAFKLRELNPKCRIIFMSGYSDKEYLKSAIQLNAISYVEKPIYTEELRSAIEKAIEQIRDEEERLKASTQFKEKFENSIPYIKNELALQLSKHNFDINLVTEHIQSLQLEFSDHSHFLTLLGEITQSNDLDYSNEIHLSDTTLKKIEHILELSGLKGLVGIKDSIHFIIHLFSDKEMSAYTKSSIERLPELFDVHLSEYSKINLSVGIPVVGLKNIYNSYNMSVLAMQKFFFNDELKISFYKEINTPGYILDESILSNYQQFLLMKDRENAILTLRMLTSKIRLHESTLIKYIKDIYHRFLIILENHSFKEQIDLLGSPASSSFLWELISVTKTLTALERLILEKTNLYFDLIHEQMQNQDLIIKVQKYIQDNYTDTNLSLKQISEANYISLVYLCSYFKEKTGKTVNQYITDIRIDKAKELLMDHTVKISNIASQVGYSDGNYFTKIFKKVTGLNPTEFREKPRS